MLKVRSGTYRPVDAFTPTLRMKQNRLPRSTKRRVCVPTTNTKKEHNEFRRKNGCSKGSGFVNRFAWGKAVLVGIKKNLCLAVWDCTYYVCCIYLIEARCGESPHLFPSRTMLHLTSSLINVVVVFHG